MGTPPAPRVPLVTAAQEAAMTGSADVRTGRPLGRGRLRGAGQSRVNGPSWRPSRGPFDRDDLPSAIVRCKPTPLAARTGAARIGLSRSAAFPVQWDTPSQAGVAAHWHRALEPPRRTRPAAPPGADDTGVDLEADVHAPVVGEDRRPQRLVAGLRCPARASRRCGCPPGSAAYAGPARWWSPRSPCWRRSPPRGARAPGRCVRSPGSGPGSTRPRASP